jgi:hypothetical protein
MQPRKLPVDRLSTLLILTLCSIALAACSNANVEFIQGKWQRSNVHFVDEWTFEGTNFSHYSAIDMINPLVENGAFQVIESEEDRLVIELLSRETTMADENREIVIRIDREAGTIAISGRIYTRPD